MGRPDYIKCIKHTHKDKEGTTWCGKSAAFEFVFQSIDHAVYTILAEGLLVPCPGCVNEILTILVLEAAQNEPAAPGSLREALEFIIKAPDESIQPILASTDQDVIKVE